MKLEHLSASRAKTFKQCQLQYHAKYELHLPEEPHPLTLMGSCVHRMFERSVKSMMTGGNAHPVDFKAGAIQEFKVDPALSPLMDELVGNAIKWGYYRNVARTAGCELEFEFELPDGTKVHGVIDRLDLNPPNADVIDLKTQKSEFSNAELADNWQADIYNVGTRKMYPSVTGNVAISFWVLRHRVQRVFRNAADAEVATKKMMDMAKEIRDCVDPKPSPSALCTWCSYKAKCNPSRLGIKEKRG